MSHEIGVQPIHPLECPRPTHKEGLKACQIGSVLFQGSWDGVTETSHSVGCVRVNNVSDMSLVTVQCSDRVS